MNNESLNVLQIHKLMGESERRPDTPVVPHSCNSREYRRGPCLHCLLPKSPLNPAILVHIKQSH